MCNAINWEVGYVSAWRNTICLGIYIVYMYIYIVQGNIILLEDTRFALPSNPKSYAGGSVSSW
jgi:hypothetical protein